MKKKKISLRHYFMFVIFGILMGAYFLTSFVLEALDQMLGFSKVFPIMAFNILLTVAVGLFLSWLLSRNILSSVTRLSEEMERVANGDFSPEIKMESEIYEIQKMNECFNQMVKDLAATETIQSDFISNVSHEIKTPINAIEGYAMLLQEEDLLPEERTQYAERILANTKRLSNLTSNVLLLAKIEAKEVLPELDNFRLDEQIRQAIVLAEPGWTAKEICLNVTMEAIFCKGNEALLFHVWMNLLNNAIKFSPTGGTIRADLRKSRTGILFTIEDDGPGIPEEEQRRIFDKFYQADRSRGKEGNGLGLALAKKILFLHNGTIRVENRAEGGSRFLVTLPLFGEFS